MYRKIPLEIFIEKKWINLGTAHLNENFLIQGIQAPGFFEYDFQYLDLFGIHLYQNNIYAASVRYPLNYEQYYENTWPSFLVDIMPSGAARKYWLKQLNLKNGPLADFDLLEKGSINPPGNIRVKTSEKLFQNDQKHDQKHDGFDYEEIINRGIDFIEYAENTGAIISGTSGAQGESPKFLLVEDINGKWHGDGALQDDLICKNWLVKFPRGKHERDYQILKEEAVYYEVARALDVNVYGPLTWDRDTLFIPRFDRVMFKDTFVRSGFESLISAMGVSEFGATKHIEDYLSIINKYSSSPQKDIKEFIFRDFLNILMGNTDNHGRNSAFIKTIDGKIKLSPLFDFAPMVLDDAGIPRNSKWRNEISHIPDFDIIFNELVKNNYLSDEEVIHFFKYSMEKLENLKSIMQKNDIDESIIHITTSKYDSFMSGLRSYINKK
ncbi:phosphatidylinositol kinase [Candidatus Magnetomorum sp. HK-1]|nr:phosphatidylinositol kinase [Candidatus Magnetomorum sp. HK-1]